MLTLKLDVCDAQVIVQYVVLLQKFYNHEGNRI